MSLAGLRRVWEEITPKKGSNKKQRNEDTHQSVLSEQESECSDVSVESGDKLSQIHQMVTNILTFQTQYKEEIKEVIQDEVCKLWAEFAERLTLLEKQVLEKDKQIADLQKRIENVEGGLKNQGSGEFQIDNTMVVMKLPYSPGENISGKVEQLLREMQVPQQVKVVRVARLPPGPHTSSPLVKVQFETGKIRDEVVRCGRNLRGSTNFRGVFVRASKSQAERQTINNFRSLIMSIPGVKEQVHLNHNGRILPNRPNNTFYHNPTYATKAGAYNSDQMHSHQTQIYPPPQPSNPGPSRQNTAATSLFT